MELIEQIAMLEGVLQKHIRKWEMYFSGVERVPPQDERKRINRRIRLLAEQTVNRRAEQFHGRADGLAMWTSDDGEAWTEVWASKKPAGKWSFDLPEGTNAKFVKLALTKPGIFHLNQVVFYGRPLSPETQDPSK